MFKSCQYYLESSLSLLYMHMPSLEWEVEGKEWVCHLVVFTFNVQMAFSMIKNRPGLWVYTMLGLLHIKRNVFHRYFSLFLTHSEYLGINASEMTPWTLRPEKNNQELCWNSKRQDKHVQNFLFRVSICFCPFPNMIKSTRSEFPSVSICFCLFPNQIKTSCTGFPSVPISFQNDKDFLHNAQRFYLFQSVSKHD